MFDSFLGNSASGVFGLVGQALNVAQNVGLAKLQNKFNIDMWNRNNEYNSPQAQMQRFSDAGLNPNLIYTQGSPGLSSAPPQLHAPQAVEMSKPLQELGKAFNIENLRTIRANRFKAEEEAKQAHFDTLNKQDDRETLSRLGELYHYNPLSGRLEFHNNPIVIEKGSVPGNRSTVSGRVERILSENALRTALIENRNSLLGAQIEYLHPQILMNRYEQKYQPWSFWIGQGAKIGNTVSNFVPKIPIQFKRPPMRYSN